jgi:glutamate-ammonia-ligase adenylyltransferase
MFEANPQLVDLIVDITATAPRLSRYLSRHSAVLDAVLDGRFFAPWPGREALVAEPASAPRRADYEHSSTPHGAGSTNGISASACISCAG